MNRFFLYDWVQLTEGNRAAPSSRLITFPVITQAFLPKCLEPRSKMTILVSLLFAAVIALVFLLLHRRYEVYSTTRHYHCAPPRKHWPKDIFFGLDFTFEMHSNLAMMKRNHDRFGLTYQSESFFGDPVLNTIAPENLPPIHSNGKHYGIQPVRLPGMEYFCGQGFLTTDGLVWLHARKMLKPSFAKQSISQLDFLGQETRKLLNKIPTDGTTIDLQHPLFITVRRIAYDILLLSVAKKRQFLHSSLHFLLGIDPSERDQAPYTAEEFIHSFHAAIFGTGLRIMLGRFRGLAPKAAYAETCRRAHEYIEYYIKRALEESIPGQESPSTHEPLRRQRSMVEELATQTNDMNFIRSQILQGMLAAQETISVLVSNTLFLLTRHPDEWAQLRMEVLDYGEALFEFHNLSSFKPLQHILNEGILTCPQSVLFVSLLIGDSSSASSSVPNAWSNLPPRHHAAGRWR